jgi:hypothetical protein
MRASKLKSRPARSDAMMTNVQSPYTTPNPPTLFSREDVAQLLAMRGGTVLHKLHCAPARRYSEDLDLVQVHAGPIGPIFDAVKGV